MKTTYHVPTEQFGFIELETENPAELTGEQVTLRIEQYKAISEAVKAPTTTTECLTSKELDLIIQNMCLGKPTVGGTELWSKATQPQRLEINRLKRALDRIKRKGEEPEVDYGEGTNGNGQD